MGLTVFIVVVQVPALALRTNMARWLPKIWLRWCRRTIGMDVIVVGGSLVEGPALFVANHISYLDVIAIGSVIDGSFVSRADIRQWPIFGFLAMLQRTVFIERNPRHARKHREELTLRLIVALMFQMALFYLEAAVKRLRKRQQGHRHLLDEFATPVFQA